MADDDIDDHPDLQRLKPRPGLVLRESWRARRNRARVKKQWRTPDVHRRQRRRTTLLIAGVVLMPIAVVAVATYWGDITGEQAAERAAVARTPPSTTQTKRIPDGVVQLHQPFVSTPAASWKNGIAGITAPKPKAIGSLSAKDVAAALKAARKTIAAAYFDRRVLEKHEFKRYLSTLAPANRREVEGKATSAAQQESYVMVIHPDYPLLPASPKAKGKLTMRAGEPGELIMRGKMAAAYAFDIDDPDRLMGGFDIVSVVKAEFEFRYHTGPAWTDSTRGIHVVKRQWETFAMNCEEIKRGYLAPYYSDRNWEGKEARHDQEFYFDPDKPLDGGPGC